MELLKESIPGLSSLFTQSCRESIGLYARANGKKIEIETIETLEGRVRDILDFAGRAQGEHRGATICVATPLLESTLGKYGIRVEFLPYTYEFTSIMLRAEIDVDEKTIFIYSPLLEELEKAVSHYCSHLETGPLEEIIEAHELFHYLDHIFAKKCGKRLSDTFHREICAHLFARELLSLTFYPWALDYVHWIYRKNAGARCSMPRLNDLMEVIL